MAGEAYAKRYAGGFVDGSGGGTPEDAQFLNAVEAALLRLLGADPTDGAVQVWDAALARFKTIQISNAQIAAAAAIDKTKLAALNIVNADVAAGAAIDGSKIAGNFPINKLNGYPADVSKVLRGNGSWAAPIIAAKLSINGSTAIPTGSATPLQLNTAYDFITDASYFGTRAGPATSFTVTVAGFYLVNAYILFPSNATGFRYAQIFKNGSAVISSDGGPIEFAVPAVSANLGTGLNFSGVVQLAVNDVITLVGNQSSGANMTPTTGWVTLSRIA